MNSTQLKDKCRAGYFSLLIPRLLWHRPFGDRYHLRDSAATIGTEPRLIHRMAKDPSLLGCQSRGGYSICGVLARDPLRPKRTTGVCLAQYVRGGVWRQGFGSTSPLVRCSITTPQLE